jgi:hypothetical protein
MVTFMVPLPDRVVDRADPSSTICEGVVIVPVIVPDELPAMMGVPLIPRMVVVPMVRVIVVPSPVEMEIMIEVDMAVGVDRVMVEEYEI